MAQRLLFLVLGTLVVMIVMMMGARARGRPVTAIAMERGEASTVRMHALSNWHALAQVSCVLSVKQSCC